MKIDRITAWPIGKRILAKLLSSEKAVDKLRHIYFFAWHDVETTNADSYLVSRQIFARFQ